MRHVYRREWRKVAALERRIADEFDLCSFVSDAEAALFAGLVPDASRPDPRASATASTIATSIPH